MAGVSKVTSAQKELPKVPVRAQVAGLVKSRRGWKTNAKKPARATVNVKALHQDFKTKNALRQEKQMKKLYYEGIKEEKREEKREERQRREERQKRREENEKKNEITQIITDKNKLKKMTRKQFRQLKKTA